MSKILAIIAEYNPFHNGHVYHFQKSKKELKKFTDDLYLWYNYIVLSNKILLVWCNP